MSMVSFAAKRKRKQEQRFACIEQFMPLNYNYTWLSRYSIAMIVKYNNLDFDVPLTAVRGGGVSLGTPDEAKHHSELLGIARAFTEHMSRETGVELVINHCLLRLRFEKNKVTDDDVHTDGGGNNCRNVTVLLSNDSKSTEFPAARGFKSCTPSLRGSATYFHSETPHRAPGVRPTGRMLLIIECGFRNAPEAFKQEVLTPQEIAAAATWVAR